MGDDSEYSVSYSLEYEYIEIDEDGNEKVLRTRSARVHEGDESDDSEASDKKSDESDEAGGDNESESASYVYSYEYAYLDEDEVDGDAVKLAEGKNKDASPTESYSGTSDESGDDADDVE